MAAADDTPGVIAPPPLIAIVALAAGLVLDWLVPVFVLELLLSFWERIVLGVLVALAGGALAVVAERGFKAVGTNVAPWQPSLRLATAGVYRHVRNPMYVGLMLLVGGIGIACNSNWTLVLLVPTAIVLSRGVVAREERYLEKKFGEEYRRYKASVPRWGIW